MAPAVGDAEPLVPPLAIAKVPAKVIVPDVVIGPPEVVRPVVPPDTATEVTVPDPPPPPDELIVWFGQVPVIVTLVPASSVGVEVPVPPLATGNKPVTPVVSGKPVALVKVPLDGVPRAPPGAT